MSIGFGDLGVNDMVAKWHFDRKFNLSGCILSHRTIPIHIIRDAINVCINAHGGNRFSAQVLNGKHDNLVMRACNVGLLGDFLDVGINRFIGTFHLFKFTGGQDRTCGSTLVTFRNPSKERNVVKVNINAIGGADNFRNLIFYGARDQRALGGRRDRVAPSIGGQNVAKHVRMDILAVNHLLRIPGGATGLRTKNAILQHGDRQIILVYSTIAGIIHFYCNKSGTSVWVDGNHTSNVTLRGLRQLL